MGSGGVIALTAMTIGATAAVSALGRARRAGAPPAGPIPRFLSGFALAFSAALWIAGAGAEIGLPVWLGLVMATGAGATLLGTRLVRRVPAAAATLAGLGLALAIGDPS